MSLIEVVWGIGMLVGGGLLGVFKPNASKVILINYMHILLGLSLAISGMLPMNGFIFFAILTAIGGVAASIYNASFTTIIQEEIDPAMMGRVFSMFYSIAILPSVIGLLSTGFIADYIGIGRTFFILGGAIVLIGLISFTVSPLMALGRRKERSEVEQDEIN